MISDAANDSDENPEIESVKWVMIREVLKYFLTWVIIPIIDGPHMHPGDRAAVIAAFNENSGEGTKLKLSEEISLVSMPIKNKWDDGLWNHHSRSDVTILMTASESRELKASSRVRTSFQCDLRIS